LTDFSKFAEKRFPQKEALYSKLSDCDIKDKNYEHAQIVFSEMVMENLGDNHDVYLRSDMLLLAENFRDLCLKNYDLDPAWYFTAPGLAWNAVLKESKIELELMSDIDMLLMIEQGILGS